MKRIPSRLRRSRTAARAAMLTATLAAAVVGVSAGAALAHHSAAVYDRTKPITLHGVVKDMLWTNPHGWIEIQTEGTKSGLWTIEMEGPIVMQREGWSRFSLLKGDRVTMRVMPLKDGRPGARLIEAVKSDGTVLHLFTPRPPSGA